MTALLRAAYQCATAGLALMALSLAVGTPDWLMDTALALLGVAAWDAALAGWAVMRDAGREAEGWTPRRPVRVGTCGLHGTVWSGPGYSSFRAFADHAPCALRDYERSGGMDRARRIAETAREIEEGRVPFGVREDRQPAWAPGPLAPAVMWQQVPRRPATEVRYRDAGNGMRDAEIIIHVELYPGAGRCICEAGPDCAWWQFSRAPKAVLLTGMVEPSLNPDRRFERQLRAFLAGKMAPGHMPECDCSECD